MSPLHTPPPVEALVFDMSKLPEELRQVPANEFALLLRAVFDLALAKTRHHHVALEAVHELVYRLTTDRRWNPADGTLRAHCLRLVPECARKPWPRQEYEACQQFVHNELPPAAPSPEELACRAEEEDDEPLPEDAKELVAALVARVADHGVASEIVAIWHKEGPVVPRELSRRLGASMRAVYSAIELIRYHMRQVLRDRDKRGREWSPRTPPATPSADSSTPPTKSSSRRPSG